MVFFLVDTRGGSSLGSMMLPQGKGSVLRDSLCPLATAMSDPERGRGGWINLANQKNE